MLRRALGYAQPEEYVDWAVQLICADVDGPNLRILAGLNLRFDRGDVEQYFLLTCGELGLQPISPNATPLQKAALVHAAFSRRDLTAAEAINMMADLYRSSERSEALLEPWMWMREELNWGDGYLYPSQALSSLDEAVRREWSLLERARAAHLPTAWRQQSWCQDCDHVGDLTLTPLTLVARVLRFVGLRSATASIVCERCGSSHHRRLGDPDVRADYLDHLENPRPAPNAGGG